MHQSHSLSSALLGSLFCCKMYSLPEHYIRCHRESAALSLSLSKQEQHKDSADNTHKQFFASLPKEERPGSSLPMLFMGQPRTFGCALFQAMGLNNRNFVGHRKFNIFVFRSCLCTLGINSSSHTAASGMRPFCSLHVTTQQRGLKLTPYLHKSVTCSIWKNLLLFSLARKPSGLVSFRKQRCLPQRVMKGQERMQSFSLQATLLCCSWTLMGMQQVGRRCKHCQSIPSDSTFLKASERKQNPRTVAIKNILEKGNKQNKFFLCFVLCQQVWHQAVGTEKNFLFRIFTAVLKCL